MAMSQGDSTQAASSFPDLQGHTADNVLSYRLVKNLRSAWADLLPGILKVKETNGEPWLPEDVYVAVMCGGAAAYEFNEADGAHAGLAIFDLMQLDYGTELALNIWIGHSEKPGRSQYGVELARLIASSMGIKHIVFSTTQRNAWLKKFRLVKAFYEVK